MKLLYFIPWQKVLTLLNPIELKTMAVVPSLPGLLSSPFQLLINNQIVSSDSQHI